MDIKNYIGKKFQRLIVIGNKLDKKTNRNLLLCKCDCGKEVLCNIYDLRNGRTKSCGCYRYEIFKRVKHGKKGTRLYEVWRNMRQRCYNKNNKDFVNYGLKGIIVCEKWKNDFSNFYDWAIGNGYNNNLTIDRIDYNGNYEPSNCRWVTIQDQQNNKSKNIFIDYNENKYTLSQLSKLLSIPYNYLYYRVKKGCDVTQIIEEYEEKGRK